MTVPVLVGLSALAFAAALLAVLIGCLTFYAGDSRIAIETNLREKRRYSNIYETEIRNLEAQLAALPASPRIPRWVLAFTAAVVLVGLGFGVAVQANYESQKRYVDVPYRQNRTQLDVNVEGSAPVIVGARP